MSPKSASTDVAARAALADCSMPAVVSAIAASMPARVSSGDSESSASNREFAAFVPAVRNGSTFSPIAAMARLALFSSVREALANSFSVRAKSP